MGHGSSGDSDSSERVIGARVSPALTSTTTTGDGTGTGTGGTASPPPGLLYPYPHPSARRGSVVSMASPVSQSASGAALPVSPSMRGWRAKVMVPPSSGGGSVTGVAGASGAGGGPLGFGHASGAERGDVGSDAAVSRAAAAGLDDSDTFPAKLKLVSGLGPGPALLLHGSGGPFAGGGGGQQLPFGRSASAAAQGGGESNRRMSSPGSSLPSASTDGHGAAVPLPRGQGGHYPHPHHARGAGRGRIFSHDGGEGTDAEPLQAASSLALPSDRDTTGLAAAAFGWATGGRHGQQHGSHGPGHVHGSGSSAGAGAGTQLQAAAAAQLQMPRVGELGAVVPAVMPPGWDVG